MEMNNERLFCINEANGLYLFTINYYNNKVLFKKKCHYCKSLNDH